MTELELLQRSLKEKEADVLRARARLRAAREQEADAIEARNWIRAQVDVLLKVGAGRTIERDQRRAG